MAAVKGSNSFVSSAEADKYFVDRLNASVWETATSDDRDKALVTATSILDQMQWKGEKSGTGILSWPRTGRYTDTSRGKLQSFTSDYDFTNKRVEAEIDVARDIQTLRRATYELSLHLLTNVDVLDDSGSIRSLKIGELKIDDIYEAPLINGRVLGIISDLIRLYDRWEGY